MRVFWWPDRALVGVGRDDRHLAHPLERLLEREEAARLDAVVVGDEDPRPAGPLAERGGACARSARGPPRAAPPATGSPRSLSRSRRSVRARSRVMSGASPSSLMSGSWTTRRPAVGSPSSMSAALPGVGLARDADRAAVALLEPACGAPGDRPVARRPVQELHHEGRHDRRDRDPEDRPRDARDAAADEHRAEDHDRVDARPRPA